MAPLTFLPEQQKTEHPKKHKKNSKNKKREKQKPKQASSSWDQIKNLLTCKQVEGSKIHDPSKNNIVNNNNNNSNIPVIVGGYSKLGNSCSSICSFKDVVHGNTRVVHRADNSPEGSSVNQETGLLNRKPSASVVRSNGGVTYTSSSRGMQFRKLSGCYECHTIVDPSRYPIPRTTICACSKCGEVFPKPESLELHQAVRHAVMELGPEDSGRNIVEIIFKSSWLKKDSPLCKIERILKVHNTKTTIQRFEDCRDTVKSRATTSTKKNPRCAADGNELLRFNCTTLTCALGALGSSSLCSGSGSSCGVCSIIRHGFQSKTVASTGVRTMASSGKAHDLLSSTDVAAAGGGGGRRAMLVCRVIAGRVKRGAGGGEVAAENVAVPEEEGLSGACYDSVANGGIYSNLEELTVYNPRAILPCFVVIYKSLD